MPTKKMKTRSLQLQDVIWEFIENVSKEELLSLSAVARKYILQGIRQAITDKILRLEIEDLNHIPDAFAHELCMFIVITYSHKIEERKDLINFFNNDITLFEKAKKEIVAAYKRTSDTTMLDLLIRADYFNTQINNDLSFLLYPKEIAKKRKE